MRNTKLMSVLLAGVLLCACALGVLFIGAGAAPSNAYVLNVGGSGEYETVAEALDTLSDGLWTTYDSVQVNINGEVTEPVSANSLLFGQKTIWVEDGKMVPILVTGEGTLSFAAGTYVNANDVTFKDLNMPVATVAFKLFAGSATVTFDNCALGTGNAYRLYADNNSAAAFEGWDEADYNALKDEDGHICTALNMKNGNYYTVADKYSTGYQIAAVGSSTDFEAEIGNVSISANNTKTAVNWENSTVSFPYCRHGLNPVAESTVYLKNCSAGNYRAAGFASGSNENYVGDIVFKVEGGTYSSFGRLMSNCTVKADTAADKAPGAANGDVTVIFDSCQPASGFETNSNNFLQTTWGATVFEGDFNLTYKNLKLSRTFFTHNSAGLTLKGDYNLNIDGLETGAVNGYFVKIGGDVTQTVKNLKIDVVNASHASLFMLQSSEFGGDVTNTFTDCSIDYSDVPDTYWYFYLGTRSISGATEPVAGIVNMTNTLKNVDILSDNIVFSCGSYWAEVEGNVTNFVDADCTFNGGFIGSNYNGGVAGNITNTIEGGVFKHSNDEKDKQTHTAYTGGIYTKGSVGGTIKNTIKGGTFGKCKNGFSAYMGSHMTSSCTVDGGIVSEISGGEFAGYFFAGNRGMAQLSNENEGQPVIKTTITGGTFHGFWAAKGNIHGDVLTVIKGGTFLNYAANYPYVFAGGGYRDDTNHISGNAITEIYGGTFADSVVAGTINRDEESEILFPGKALLRIYGGEFQGNIYANSYGGVGKKTYTDGELIIDTTKAEAAPLVINGAVGTAANVAAGHEADTFNVSVKAPAEGAVIKIGEDANIVADTAEGKLTLLQTQRWLGHDYFAAPATVDLAVEQEEGVIGKYQLQESETILLKGGYDLVGATLIFEDRVGIRVLMNKKDAAIYADSFAYSVAKEGEDSFLNGTGFETWIDPADGTEYASFVIKGIGLADFGQEFTVNATGLRQVTFSVDSLAAIAESAWSGDWKEFAIAIQNLHDVYSGSILHDESVYVLNTPAYGDVIANGDTEKVIGASAALSMTDAVGVKLSLTLAEGYAPSALNVKFNGEAVALVPTVEGASVTLTAYFNAKYMTEVFDLEILDGEAVLFSLHTSVERLNYGLAIDAQNEKQENAQALLYYVQKAAAAIA